MYLIVESNPNCDGDERVFADKPERRPVSRVYLDGPGGKPEWFDVAGVDDGGAFGPATAALVDDSGAGVAWLIYGGAWGVRLKPSGPGAWSLEEASQWGRPFLVLDHAAKEIQFSEGKTA